MPSDLKRELVWGDKLLQRVILDLFVIVDTQPLINTVFLQEYIHKYSTDSKQEVRTETGAGAGSVKLHKKEAFLLAIKVQHL